MLSAFLLPHQIRIQNAIATLDSSWIQVGLGDFSSFSSSLLSLRLHSLQEVDFFRATKRTNERKTKNTFPNWRRFVLNCVIFFHSSFLVFVAPKMLAIFFVLSRLHWRCCVTVQKCAPQFPDCSLVHFFFFLVVVASLVTQEHIFWSLLFD